MLVLSKGFLNSVSCILFKQYFMSSLLVNSTMPMSPPRLLVHTSAKPTSPAFLMKSFKSCQEHLSGRFSTSTHKSRFLGCGFPRPPRSPLRPPRPPPPSLPRRPRAISTCLREKQIKLVGDKNRCFFLQGCTSLAFQKEKSDLLLVYTHQSRIHLSYAQLRRHHSYSRTR